MLIDRERYRKSYTFAWRRLAKALRHLKLTVLRETGLQRLFDRMLS